MSGAIDLGLWTGRRQERADWVDPNRLAAWSATLDRDDPLPVEGDRAPPGFHWTLFHPIVRQSELGPDGHARRGEFLPPVPLPRRMWAGGRLRFFAPLRVGERVHRVSIVDRVEEKRGRTGPLVFVTVRHIVSATGVTAVEEEQDIVYREAPRPGGHGEEPAGARAPQGAWRRHVAPDDMLLFRYSALTFNGHRIHYDRRYVTEVEGYPGLVVHGPLLATLMLDLVRRSVPEGEVTAFRFKSIRPVFDVAPFTVEGTPGDDPCRIRLWSTNDRGETAMEGEAEIR